MRSKLTRAFVVGSVAIAGGAACQLVAGIERVDKEPSPDVMIPAPDVITTDPDPCQHRGVPPRPNVGAADPNVLPPAYFALRTSSIVTAEDGDGLDLDGVCTCERRPATVLDGGSSCVTRIPDGDCDGDGGVDNQLGALFRTVSATPEELADRADVVGVSVENGMRTVLIYLAGWNGQPDDPAVEVGLAISRGIADPSGCGVADASRTTAPIRYRPTWCGKDKWTYATGTMTFERGLPVPVFRGEGYVSGGTLVYKQNGPLTVFFGARTSVLTSPTVTARIERGNDGITRVRGVLSGRFGLDELLSALGGSVSGKACQQATFGIYKQVACNYADLSRTELLDRTGAPCEAISAAIRFTGEVAELGAEVQEDEPLTPCSPENVDASLYTCPPR